MKGLIRNAAKDIAAGVLIAAIVLFVILVGLKLFAHETKPRRDFRASIESEIISPDQHIFP